MIGITGRPTLVGTIRRAGGELEGGSDLGPPAWSEKPGESAAVASRSGAKHPQIVGGLRKGSSAEFAFVVRERPGPFCSSPIKSGASRRSCPP